ncbi:MAG: [FeFe] hydrogenase H-cluster maturation GTPase HydF [Clostridia bacterium]|nr:[FeFe] hydrogenase H-cluster maturation GTPase HydF [Clostridia bacterium]
MGINDVVSAERLHIGFFGMRNAGKSSVVNAVIGQTLSVVSHIKGTTTDPVKKTMELLPIGPVVIIDTPGIDDSGELGELRIEKSKQVMSRTDIAVLIVDAEKGLDILDEKLISVFQKKNLPYIIVYNKSDLIKKRKELKHNEIYISALKGENIYELKEKIGAYAKKEKNNKVIVSDLLTDGDMVVLVIPIDEAAPKGRLILPQQQTIREILDAHCYFAACQETELETVLNALAFPPKLVITDSQVFEAVAKTIPDSVMLTSFSILFARYKGELKELIKGAARLSHLKDGDKILISEGCTHHRQCGDIGTVKLPAWVKKFANKNIEFDFTSGTDFSDDLSEYALIIHCGGCMLNNKEMQNRIEMANSAGVPVVNYGVAIAQMNGILKRALSPFPEVMKLVL